MRYRTRTHCTDTQKALMWERWKQGWTLHQIAQRSVPRSRVLMSPDTNPHPEVSDFRRNPTAKDRVT